MKNIGALRYFKIKTENDKHFKIFYLFILSLWVFHNETSSFARTTKLILEIYMSLSMGNTLRIYMGIPHMHIKVGISNFHSRNLSFFRLRHQYDIAKFFLF